MSHEVILELGAAVELIAEAIERVQAGSKVRRCQDPAAMARQVRDQVDIAQRMAEAAGTDLAHLYAGGTWWDGSVFRGDGDATLVSLDATRLRVYRGSPPNGNAQGSIHLTLHPKSECPLDRWARL